MRQSEIESTATLSLMSSVMVLFLLVAVFLTGATSTCLAEEHSTKAAAPSRVKTSKGGKSAVSEENGKATENAYFAAGCFWKVQYVFSKVPGVIATKAGYTGGNTENPNYRQVCGHGTGHAEAVRVEFNPKKVSYKQLLEVFWSHHDPTTLNRQGPDIGDQYRSEIFYEGDAQKQAAELYLADLQKSRKFASPIVTKLEPITKFYDAEEYHQDYFKKHGQVCD